MNFPIKLQSLNEISSYKKVVEEILSRSTPQKSPFLVHGMGIPGAGKSSLIASLSENLVDLSPITVSFDKIMKSAPEYALAANITEAFALYELPARAAGYVLVEKLMQIGANILFDHTASSPDHIDLIKFAKQAGYRVAMIHVTAPPELVKERIKLRQVEEQRYTPLNYVDERLAIIESLTDQYKLVSDLYMKIENRDMPPVQRPAFFRKTSEAIGPQIRALIS